MLSPITWLLRSIPKSSKTKRVVKQPGHAFIESLETRQLLTTIFTETFEGDFPSDGGWTTNVDSGRKWDDTNNKSHNGGWSAFCADLADNTNQSSYIDNLDTVFSKTVDLSHFRNVELEWWRWIKTEQTHDRLEVSVSKAGLGTVTMAPISGDQDSWIKDSFAIPEGFWGQSGVTIQFKFHSDFSAVPVGNAGVWIDDIELKGFLDYGFPEPTVNVPGGAVLRLNQFGNITVNDTITSAVDNDMWGFGVKTGGNYTITVSGPVDVQFRVYNKDGNAITGLIDNLGVGGTETVTLNRSAGEGCYIVVGGWTDSIGDYTLTVNGPSATVANVNVPSPNFDGNQSGAINFEGDRDYYRLVAPADTDSLSISLHNAATLNGYFTLLDTNGNVLTNVNTGGTGDYDTLFDYPITAVATYILMVSGSTMSEGSSADESYDFDFNFGPNNDGQPPSKITVPDGINLRLNQLGDISGVGGSINDKFDYRIYGFGVETTGNHTITVTGALDTELRIYDSNGNAITPIQDVTGSNSTETLTVSLNAGQTCYFVVAGYGSLTGSYSLSVNGPSASPSTPSFSAPNYFVSGSNSINQPGDRDYYALTAPAGTNVLSVIMNSSAGLDGVLSLFDSNGNLLQQKDAGSGGVSESIVNFAVTGGQSYVVMFSGYSLNEGVGGAESYSYSFDFGPDLSDNNVAPEIPAGQELLIAENSAANTVVGGVVANDANSTAPNNVLTYSILNGSPSNPFSINPSTGVITFTGNPSTLNFENIPEYTLTVKVTDGGNLSATQAVTVKVGDVNETPSIPANQTLQVLENSDVGTVVGTVLADDPDNNAPNSTLTYSIVNGSPSNPFSIDPVTGEITVANPAALDFETTTQFSLQVKVTDSGNGNLNATQTVKINLVDANDGPSIAAGQTFSVDENSLNGSSVGTVVASDPDTTAPNNSLTYSITGGNTNNAFAINPATGAITVNNSAELDFEANPSYSLTITVTDGGNLTASQSVTVNLNNINEAPILTGTPAGSPTYVGKVKSPVIVFPAITVKDPDGAAELTTVTFSVSIPGGKKNFDVVNLTAAAGLVTISETIVASTRKYTLTLNGGVTSSQVESFLRSITFSTSKAGLKTLTRTFQASVTDSQGATSNLATQVINVRKK